MKATMFWHRHVDAPKRHCDAPEACPNKSDVLGGSLVRLMDAPALCGGMRSWKKFENLHTTMAILVLFEQFSCKFLFKFFAPNSECLTKYDRFVPKMGTRVE